MDAVEIPTAVTDYHQALERELQAILEGRDLPFYRMVRYALGWEEADESARKDGGGKALRPALCLLAAEALAGELPAKAAIARALPGAAAVELIHNFSLVHDDIQDQDEERHHRPTVWAQWGVAQAINVGDAMRELAQLALSRAEGAGAPPAAILAAHRLLTKSSLAMIEGQFLDLTYEQRASIDVDEYLTMIERKTGAMMSSSLALGGLLAGAEADTVARLQRAGSRLGVCFQIRDDYLGLWGDSAITGKSTDNDIRRRKKSYPIVHAVQHSSDGDRATLETIYAQSSVNDEDIAAVRDILQQTSAVEATQEAAHEHHSAFTEELDGCPLQPAARATLDAVAQFIVLRDH